MINGMMFSPGAIRRLVGTLAVTVFLSACVTPEPLKRPSTVAVPEDETARYLEDVRGRMMKLWLHPASRALRAIRRVASRAASTRAGLILSRRRHHAALLALVRRRLRCRPCLVHRSSGRM
jgi:hypothetical protein